VSEGRARQQQSLAALASALAECEANRSAACQQEAEAKKLEMGEVAARLVAERERLSAERRCKCVRDRQRSFTLKAPVLLCSAPHL
jgi:hypothetical protein